MQDRELYNYTSIDIESTTRGVFNMGGLRGRLKKIKAYIRDYLPKANFFQRLLVFFDAIWTCKYYGCSIDDYFRYQFFQRRHFSRKDFIVWRQRKRIINTCNKVEDRDIFISKPRFNKLFQNYLGGIGSMLKLVLTRTLRLSLSETSAFSLSLWRAPLAGECGYMRLRIMRTYRNCSKTCRKKRYWWKK